MPGDVSVFKTTSTGQLRDKELKNTDCENLVDRELLMHGIPRYRIKCRFFTLLDVPESESPIIEHIDFIASPTPPVVPCTRR